VVTTAPDFISSVSSPLAVATGNLTVDLSAYAPLASPAFTGTPTAPTPSPGTDSTQIATTAWVKNFDYAPTNSPTLTGNPKSVTPSTGDNDTSIATTAFVKGQNYITSSALTPYLTTADAASTYALKTNGELKGNFTLDGTAASPNSDGSILIGSTFAGYDFLNISSGRLEGRQGTPQKTFTLDATDGLKLFSSGLGVRFPDASTQTVAYPGPSGFLLKADNLSGLADTSTARTNLGLGTMATATASDYSTTTVANGLYYPLSSNPSSYLVAADIAGKADLASPALTGTPTAPTATLGTNTTQIATTAFVLANAPAAPVTSVAGRTGAVTLAVADVSGAAPLESPTFTGTVTIPSGASISGFAPLASPTFTGTPSLPTGTIGVTQTAGDNTTALATTAFVTAAVPAFGAQADINEPLSSTKAASIENVRELLLSPGYQMFYQGLGVNGTSGTGAAVNANSGRWKEYVSPNTGVAGHAKGVFDTTSTSIGFAGYQRGANLTSRNWSKKMWISGRCMIGHFSLTSYNGSANTFARISLGGYTVIGAGDMLSTTRGIGWKLQGGGSSALELQVSNGTTVTTVTSSFTPTLKQCFDWEIYSDGAGNVTLYVNDSQVATTTAGPTGTQTNGLYIEGVDTTASSTAPFILNNLGTKIFVAI
jgi:hypothetical protein